MGLCVALRGRGTQLRLARTNRSATSSSPQWRISASTAAGVTSRWHWRPITRGPTWKARWAKASLRARCRPPGGRPERTASATQAFSSRSQGSRTSSFTLIGPPRAISRSIPSRGGGEAPGSNQRVQLMRAPRDSSQGPMQPRPSNATCCRTWTCMAETSCPLQPTAPAPASSASRRP